MVAFILNFPNTPTWNGSFSGSGKFYAVTRKLPKQREQELANLSFFYRWDDGWSALITCAKITAPEAEKVRRKSSGFWGYEWMVDSIIKNGEIITPPPQ